MTLHSDISRALGWYRGSRQAITISVVDSSNTPINLSNTNVSWRVSKARGSAVVYLTKTPNISGNSNNIVTITIDPDTDYNSLPAGIHWHELWDEDNEVELCNGDANVLTSVGLIT